MKRSSFFDRYIDTWLQLFHSGFFRCYPGHLEKKNHLCLDLTSPKLGMDMIGAGKYA